VIKVASNFGERNAMTRPDTTLQKNRSHEHGSSEMGFNTDIDARAMFRFGLVTLL
jgi:hypothetical protein